MPYSAENKDVHDSAYEAACDTLLAYAPQIAHTHGFEMLATNAPKGILNDSIGLTIFNFSKSNTKLLNSREQRPIIYVI